MANTNAMVHILLSTYNGSRFLAEQLDSIFGQTYPFIHLYIRDDGSTDNTKELIKEYLDLHPEAKEKTTLLDDLAADTNLGYMGSFWQLLLRSGNADYYAFCDQDDVWLPDKIAVGVEAMEKSDASVPLLFFSQCIYCDEQLLRLHEGPEPDLPLNFRDTMFYTYAFGFTMMFNESLRERAIWSAAEACKDKGNLHTADSLCETGEKMYASDSFLRFAKTAFLHIPHDGWLEKTAAAFGQILYNNTPSALYRRHNDAVTSNNRNRLKAIQWWLSHEVFGDSMRLPRYVLSCFYKANRDQLLPSDRETLLLFVTKRKSPLIWFKRVFFPHRLRPGFGGELALRICFFLNRW